MIGNNRREFLISVIIPVYKVEAHIRRCVESIINQSYKNLEIILVDDGSPDYCGVICDEYAEIDKRIKVIHKENGGTGSARNAGLDIATGEYIAFVDSDDYVDLDMYEILQKIAVETNADVIECGYRWIKPEGIRDLNNTRKVDFYSNMEALEELYFGEQISGGVSIVVWNKLYRSELLENIRFIEKFAEDIEFTPRIYYHANKIVKYNYNFYNFFFSQNSSTRSEYTLKKTKKSDVMKKTMNFFAETGLRKYEDYTFILYVGILYNDYYECRRRRKDKQYDTIYKEKEQELKKCWRKIVLNPYKTPFIKHYIYHISPTLWYTMAHIWKTIKQRY